MMGSSKMTLPLTFREVLGNAWSVLGCFMYPTDAPARLAALVRAGLLNLESVRARGFPMGELNAAMDAAAVGRGLDATVLLPKQ
jgi:alcohol dehydrogenase